MHKKPAILLLVYLVAAIYSHEICMDTTGAKQVPMSYCTDYNNYSCCSADKESEIRGISEGLQLTSDTCKQFMKKTLCSQCDPWGAHLFGIETDDKKDFPILCPSYCTEFYASCKDEVMNWPAGKNPFGTNNKLSVDYPTETAFCEAFKPITNYTACYSGKKYEPAVAPVDNTPTQPFCVEYFGPGSFDVKPMAIASPNDGTNRIFIPYKTGEIKVVHQQNGSVIGTFLRVNVLDNGEAGLIGMVTHPNYKDNKKFYLFWSCPNCPITCTEDSDCEGLKCSNGYCANLAMTNMVEEYQASSDPNVANPTPLRTFMKLPKAYLNHNGGQLLFGPDGKLYITVGDGGLANDPFNLAQNINSRNGKVLRIDVDAAPTDGRTFAIPSDNPFIGKTKFPEIYALGFRNPWRGSFDRANPSYLYIGDVGQDAVEEVDLVKKGGNYGWPKYEGDIITPTKKVDGDVPNHIKPILQYSHNTVTGGPAVIGGYVYRGTKDTCNYGRYIYAEFNQILFSSAETFSGSGVYQQPKKMSTVCAEGAVNCGPPGNIFAFGEDNNGDLYMLGSNRIVRVVETSRCPAIKCSISDTTPQQTAPVTTGVVGTETPETTGASVDETTPLQTEPVTGSGDEGTFGSEQTSGQSEQQTNDVSQDTDTTDEEPSDPLNNNESSSQVLAVSTSLCILAMMANL